MLDKWLKELGDFRINVIERGLRVVYLSKVDDHSGEVYEKRLHRIRWGPPDGNPEHEVLKQKKKDYMEDFAENAYFIDEPAVELEVNVTVIEVRS